ncbi:MAG: DUF692 family protein [Anaerolineae bacterium]|nr:DUF692 family protein [Anaerolineae bacterium]
MAPQIGCNYSGPLMRLLAEGAADVDWIKLARQDTLAEDLAAARAVRPVLLHHLPPAGARPEVWEGFPWALLSEHLAMAGSPHIALHLWIGSDDWDEPVDIRWQSADQARPILQRLVANTRRVREQTSLPVLIENVPYYGARGSLRLTIQPEVLWQVAEEAGAGLLLDAGHLRCTAYNLGVDVHAYAQALPLGLVREMHVSGPRLTGASLVDRHHALEDEDYALIEWLLERTQPQIVTLEYGGTGEPMETALRNDPIALQSQLVRLRRLMGLAATR